MKRLIHALPTPLPPLNPLPLWCELTLESDEYSGGSTIPSLSAACLSSRSIRLRAASVGIGALGSPRCWKLSAFTLPSTRRGAGSGDMGDCSGESRDGGRRGSGGGSTVGCAVGEECARAAREGDGLCRSRLARFLLTTSFSPTKEKVYHPPSLRPASRTTCHSPFASLVSVPWRYASPPEQRAAFTSSGASRSERRASLSMDGCNVQKS